MTTKLITISAALICITTLLFAQLPLEESWSIDLDITGARLQEFHDNYNELDRLLIVSTDNKVALQNFDEIEFVTDSIGSEITCVQAIDFMEDGELTILICSYNEQYALIHKYNNQDQRDTITIERLRDEYIDGDYEESWNDHRRISWIGKIYNGEADSTESIYVFNYGEYGYSSILFNGNGFDMKTGYVWKYSFASNQIRIIGHCGHVENALHRHTNEDDDHGIVTIGSYSSSSWESGSPDTYESKILLTSSDDTQINNEREISNSRYIINLRISPVSQLNYANENGYIFLMEDTTCHIVFVDEDSLDVVFKIIPDMNIDTDIVTQVHPYRRIENEESEDYLFITTTTGVYLMGGNYLRNLITYDVVVDGVIDTRLGDFDGDGEIELAALTADQLIFYDIGVLSADSDPHGVPFPTTYAITAAYPNPFNSSATIEYSLPKAGEINVKLYDLHGKEVSRIADGFRNAGEYRGIIDGSQLPSGTYLIRLDGENTNSAKRIQLLK